MALANLIGECSMTLYLNGGPDDKCTDSASHGGCVTVTLGSQEVLAATEFALVRDIQGGLHVELCFRSWLLCES